MRETEQTRKYYKRVTLQGTLAELKTRTGITKAGVKYLSVDGIIKFGPNSGEHLAFTKFTQETTSEGKESIAYQKLQDWVKSVIPMTESVENASKVNITGELASKMYWSDNNNKVVETTVIEALYFNEYDSSLEANAYLDFEGSIYKMTDELRGEEPTGRKIVSLIAPDTRDGAIILKKLILADDIASDFEDAFKVGDTAKFFIDFVLHKGQTVKRGGLGVQRATEGKSYLEWVLTGAEDPYTEDKDIISNKAIKAMLAERNAKIESLQDGGSKPAAKTVKIADIIPEEELPF